jgi:Sec-independent protein translocase protein TatA
MTRCYHPRMDLAIVLIIVLVVVIMWRGPKTLPLLGRAFGQGVREARKEIDEMKAESAAEKKDNDPGTSA